MNPIWAFSVWFKCSALGVGGPYTLAHMICLNCRVHFYPLWPFSSFDRLTAFPWLMVKRTLAETLTLKHLGINFMRVLYCQRIPPSLCYQKGSWDWTTLQKSILIVVDLIWGDLFLWMIKVTPWLTAEWRQASRSVWWSIFRLNKFTIIYTIKICHKFLFKIYNY